MASKNRSDVKSPGERVYKLIQLSGLELSGFAEFTSISESHIYAVINGTKELTENTADKIADVFDLKGFQLLNPNFRLTKKLSNASSLVKFYKENKGVYKYFVNTRIDRKVAYFIEYEVLSKKQFAFPFTVGKVREACLEAGRKYTSKRISQVLNYLVATNKLRRKKEHIIKKDGNTGKRFVDVFSKV